MGVGGRDLAAVGEGGRGADAGAGLALGRAVQDNQKLTVLTSVFQYVYTVNQVHST